jgi:hypothetical protein
MAADNQMTDDLAASRPRSHAARWTTEKANRLFTGRAWELIPRYRYLGNAVLSLLTKVASGYWHRGLAVRLHGDRPAHAAQLDLHRVYARYGFPNDLLVHLNVGRPRPRCPSRPVAASARSRASACAGSCRRSRGCSGGLVADVAEVRSRITRWCSSVLGVVLVLGFALGMRWCGSSAT